MKIENYSIFNKVFSFFNGGHERSVLIKKNIAASFIIRGFSILTNYLLVPITIDYLNPTNYGIWLTLSSIITWFNFLDVGLGNGLRNKFTQALAKNNIDLAKSYLSTTYAILSLMAIVVYPIFLIISSQVDWSVILNTSGEEAEELRVLANVVFAFFLIRFVLRLIGVIIIADQKIAISNSFDLLSNIIALVIIYILTKTTSGSLLYLGLVISVAPVLVLFLASLFFYNSKYKIYRPSIRFINLGYVKDLTGLGFQFFVIQISFIVFSATDNIIITQILGPQEVTPYNISQKLFSIILIFFTILLSPLWSAITDAYEKKELQWIKNTINKSIKIWLLVLPITLVILIFSDQLYILWIGDQVSIPFALSACMALFVLMRTFTSIFTIFINGTGKIRIQMINSIFTILINIPISIYLAKNVGLGTTGVILGTCISASIGLFLRPIQYYKIINGKGARIWYL